MYSSNGPHMSPLVNMYGSHPPVVTRFRLQTTGTYNNQMHRPYEPNLYGQQGRQMLDSLSEMMIRQNNKFAPSNFTSPTTALVTQAATPEDQVYIANGWQERKLRFYLEMEVTDLAGGKMLHTYTGYSENADLSHTNSFDPRMRFFIAHTDSMRCIQRVFGNGQRTSGWEVTDSSQILINTNFSSPGAGAFGPNQIYSMQPEKVFQYWENNAFSGVETNDHVNGQPELFRDGRVQLTGTPTKTKLIHNLAPTYTRDLLNSYLSVATSSDSNLDHSAMMIECAARSRALTVDEDPFFKAIKDLRRQRSGGYLLMDQTFTFEELCAIDPNAINMVNPPDTIRNIEGLHNAGVTAPWSGSDRVTQTASILAQALPAYMSRCGLHSVVLTSTNVGTLDNRCVTTLSHVVAPNQSLSMEAQLDSFKVMLDAELFPSITLGGQLGYWCRARVDRIGETWLDLSLNGEPVVTFVCPSFADSLMAPVATRDATKVSTITESMDQISNRYWENRGGQEAASLAAIRI